jgi:hypothetical protein
MASNIAASSRKSTFPPEHWQATQPPPSYEHGNRDNLASGAETHPGPVLEQSAHHAENPFTSPHDPHSVNPSVAQPGASNNTSDPPARSGLNNADNDDDSLYMSASPFSNIPSGVDLNTTAGNEKELHIPAVMFGIPFPMPIALTEPVATTPHDPNDPKAVKAAEKAAKKEEKLAARRPALLLYALPRAPYRRPPETEDGKPGKQKFVKRVERKWQEEVAEANKVREGEVPEASRWKKMKAPLAQVRYSRRTNLQ